MSSEGFTNACARSGGSKRKPQSSWNPVSGEREDVVQLDVEAVCTADRELRDPVALLEAQHELLAGVISRVELVEAEDERRRLLAGGEQQARLDVVRAPEVLRFAQLELPILARRDPILERRRVDAERVVDLDLDRSVRPLLGRLTRVNVDRWHGRAVPA